MEADYRQQRATVSRLLLAGRSSEPGLRAGSRTPLSLFKSPATGSFLIFRSPLPAALHTASSPARARLCLHRIPTRLLLTNEGHGSEAEVT